MTRLLLCSLVVCLSLRCDAQKQGNHWLFGIGSGLSFNSTPPSILGNATQGGQASSSIAESNGQLLFWSNGRDIYGRHGLLSNGSAVGSIEEPSRPASIILPRPGSDSIFYLFTSDAYQNYPGASKAQGYNYTVLDACKGWKTREVVTGEILAGQRKIKIADSGSSLLCATVDGKGGYWVLGHRMFSDSFIAWHLEKTGITDRVGTRIGPRLGAPGTKYPLQNYFMGAMKFNDSGTRVAMASPFASGGPNATLHLFKFNKTTGKLDSACQNSYGIDAIPRGVEFSPNCAYLYSAYEDGPRSYVIRNVISDRCNWVGLSRDTVYKTAGRLTGMQIGADSIIYVAFTDPAKSKASLHRIINSDGAYTYDTTGLQVSNKLIPSYNLPYFLIGYRYHNQMCKCIPPKGLGVASAILDGIRFVPNPAHNSVSIQADGSLKNCSISISDAMGRNVYRSPSVPESIDLSRIPAGMYFWQISDGLGSPRSGTFSIAH